MISITGNDVEFGLDPVLTARALIGGVVEVLVDWINGDVDASPEEIVDHFTRLSTVAMNAALLPEQPARRAGRQRRK